MVYVTPHNSKVPQRTPSFPSKKNSIYGNFIAKKLLYRMCTLFNVLRLIWQHNMTSIPFAIFLYWVYVTSLIALRNTVFCMHLYYIRSLWVSQRSVLFFYRRLTNLYPKNIIYKLKHRFRNILFSIYKTFLKTVVIRV